VRDNIGGDQQQPLQRRQKLFGPGGKRIRRGGMIGGGRLPIIQDQLDNRRRRRRFSDQSNNIPIRQQRPLKRLGGLKQQQPKQLLPKQVLQQPKVVQTRRLKVRNLDENKVSNEDLKVR
jgi:hypothetical protein